MASVKFGVGQSVTRKEDDPLIRGKGHYTDDYASGPVLHALVLRSPHAHANFTIDTSAASKLPGVAAILTAEDTADLGVLPCLFNLPDEPFTAPPYPILSRDTVRHVGDAIAFVVAETMDQARDAVEAIVVQWKPLPAVIGLNNAVKKDAPQVWPDHPGNVLFDTSIGDKAKTEAAFKDAHAVAEISIVNPRVVTNYMEPRAVVCEYDVKREHFTLTIGSQGSHRLRDILCENVLKIPKDKMRVICPDVGGGFGTRLFPYREYALVAVAARKLRRTVKWTAERSDHFLGDAQGRDNVTTARMALAADGKFLGMDVDLMGDMGGYLSTFGPYIPHGGAGMLPGLYDIQAFYCRIRAVFTNTVPVDAYRGAGRPEAAYVVERLVDAAARKLGMTPDAIRRKNFIAPKALPYTTATGKVYDSGDFAAHLKRAMDIVEWKEFPKRLKAAKKQGLLRGIGLGSYVEVCGTMGEDETAQVRLDPNGDVTILIGTQSSGQGHQTAYAQIVAEQFGLSPERVHILQGDTDVVATGLGTGGSSSIPSGGVSVQRATRKLGVNLKEIAADALETSAADLEIRDGFVQIAGTDRSMSFADIAKRSSDPSKLMASEAFNSADGTYPNGTHVVEVEIDPATGRIRIVNYVIVDDFGVTLNPLLLEGQVHGGTVQGIGQALMEQAVYDLNGQLMTGTFMDYALPRAADGPSITFETHNVPCKTNPLGVKGAGEAGAIGSCPAVVNAIIDGLWREYKIDHIDMPATAERVWMTIAEHQRRHRL
ncbi:xanthine dehydrogenase family protein molybdopterin-binding subunit [Bradyrhizobium sp. SYSU BS000235]|uniref:xanthine dehydrogenase family protein molybdopterin-binding subunit n=1 Tax=Bradyrhizobium sp. SYSU BS000235 TaxID=3411332 RepID=UPI003C79705C